MDLSRMKGVVEKHAHQESEEVRSVWVGQIYKRMQNINGY